MSEENDEPKPGAPTRNDVPPPPVDRKPDVPPPPPSASQGPGGDASPPPVAPARDGGANDEGGGGEGAGEAAAAEERVSPFKEEKLLGTFCHLLSFAGFLVWGVGNIVGPLVLWLFKKDASKVVDREGRNSINFQVLFTLAALLVAALFGVLSQIPLLGVLFVFLGGLLLSALIIANVVCVVMAVVNLNSGKVWKYPLTYDFVGLVDRVLKKPPAAS